MSIYSPDDDSFLLSDIVKKEIKKLIINTSNLKILDMGSGSGIQAKTAIDAGANPKKITLSDISSEAIKFLKENFTKSKIIKSNLFEKIKGKFDLIIFNPPYLPEDKREPKDSKLATTGGKKGDEMIIKFLKQAKPHLTQDGKILILTSSLTPKINFKKLGYNSEIIAKKKLFFEELKVLVLSL
jgi:release factor glutamine methyltransferase